MEEGRGPQGAAATVRCTGARRLADGVGRLPTRRRYRTTKDDGDVYDGRDDRDYHAHHRVSDYDAGHGQDTATTTPGSTVMGSTAVYPRHA